LEVLTKHIYQPTDRIPLSRQCIVYVSLICFLNIIFFPSLPSSLLGIKLKNLKSGAIVCTLTDHMLEDCSEPSMPDCQEKDMGDISEITDDNDILDHISLYLDFSLDNKRNNQYNSINLILAHSFYSCSTPPPEQSI
jgi:hypothetical protein